MYVYFVDTSIYTLDWKFKSLVKKIFIDLHPTVSFSTKIHVIVEFTTLKCNDFDSPVAANCLIFCTHVTADKFL